MQLILNESSDMMVTIKQEVRTSTVLDIQGQA